MALDENASVQALLGEAIDLLMRERGNIRWESVKVFHMKQRFDLATLLMLIVQLVFASARQPSPRGNC
jgi:hypothetical protein